MGAWKRSATTKHSLLDCLTCLFHLNASLPCSRILFIVGVISMWAHALVDSGATVYVSHGDPRLQGIEIYNGCPIFYCLGSFIFQTKTEIGFYGPEVWQSCIVTLEYHAHTARSATATTATTTAQPCDPQRRKATRTAPLPSPTFSIRLTPLTLNEVGVGESQEMQWQTRGLPRVAKGEEGRKILEHVAAMSAVFGTVVVIEELGKEEGSGGGSEEGVGVVGWVTGGGTARVGERTDPTIGAEVGTAAGSKQKDAKAEVKAADVIAEEKRQADGPIEVK